jgi:hypothetical protein
MKKLSKGKMEDQNKKNKDINKASDPYRYDYIDPCFEMMDDFFQAHGEWLDIESDYFTDDFQYKGYGVWDHETKSYSESIPVLRLGKVTVNQFLRDGDSLVKYYDYAWKYLKLGELIEFFVDDLKTLTTLNIVAVPDRMGGVTWEAIALLYYLYDDPVMRKRCLHLAMRRADRAFTTRALILASAETLKARGMK